MSELKDGSRVGGYRILGLLGRGGMGSVYKAQEEKTGRVVALKVVAREDAHDPRLRERFQREGAAAASIAHPNVIVIHMVGEHEGVPYLVFEYLPGGTLADRVAKTGPLPWREAATLGVKLARALEAVHASGAVHRDLKPENVLFDAASEPKLSDFGLVRMGQRAEGLTRQGELLGTFAYMAPEQADSSHDVDGRADLYSLGALLYTALTGEKPFTGSGYALLKQVMVEAPRPVHEITPGVPAALDQLVLRLLAKAPARRPGRASEVATALEAILSGRAGSRSRARLLAVVIVVLVGGAAVTLALRGNPGKARDPDLPAPVTTVSSPPGPAPAEAPKAAPVTRLMATWGYPELVHGALKGQPHGGPHAVAFTPDGKRLVSGGYDGVVKVWDVTTGDLVKAFTGHGRAVFAVAVSPDGKTIVSVGEEAVARVWDLKTFERLRPLVGHTAGILDVAFLPDGRVLTGSEDRTARLWDVARASLIDTLPFGQAPVHALAVSPDGKRAVVACQENPTAIVDLVSRVILGSFGDATKEVSSLAFSKDGKRILANAGKTATVWSFENDKATLERTLQGHTAAVRRVAFTPAGLGLTGSFDHTARLWNLESGKTVRTFDGLEGWVAGVAVSPDGTTVATASLEPDRSVRLFDSTTGKEKGTEGSHWTRIDGIVFLPGGERAVSTSHAGPRRVFAVATGKEVEGARVEGSGTFAVTLDLRRELVHDNKTGVISVRDVANGSVNALDTQPRNYFGVFLPDGNGVLLAAGHALTVYDVGTQKKVRTFDHDTANVLALALSGDGTLALTTTDDTNLRLWEVSTGKPLTLIDADGRRIAHAVLSFDGKLALTASPNRKFQLWDLEAARRGKSGLKVELTGSGGEIVSVALAPDGRHALVAGVEGRVTVWNLETASAIATIALAPDRGRALAFAPDGHSFLVGSDHRLIRRYAFEPGGR